MLESAIERRLVAECRRRGLWTRKFASPAHRGVPDRVICGNGKTLFLELKREGQAPTALQLHELTLIRAAGIAAEWSAGWTPTLAVLNRHFPECI